VETVNCACDRLGTVTCDRCGTDVAYDATEAQSKSKAPICGNICEAAGANQKIKRSIGPDDNLFECGIRLPWKFAGTADPSASVGMTKVRVVLPLKSGLGGGMEKQVPVRLGSGQALHYARYDKGWGGASYIISRLVADGFSFMLLFLR
jgi:hypothetical protein